MFEIYCPYCQEVREQDEFSVADEAFIARPKNPETISDKQWAEYVFLRTNKKGQHWEQWVHSQGCRKYFLVKRSTIDHSIEQVEKFAAVKDKSAS